MTEKKHSTPVARTTAGLRDVLFDTIDKLRAGEIEVEEASAIANLSKVIVQSVSVQLAYERARLANEVPAVLPEMRLTPALPAK